MTYRVNGTLKLPDGSPAANCEIEFVSRKNLSPTVQGSKTNILTSATGYYDVTLELGEYAVIIYAGGTYPSQAGVIAVLADTTPGQDLPTLLSNGELLPTTPDYMQQIQAWLVAANEAADDSAASAVASEASAQAAAASAATTAAAVTAHEEKPAAHPISGVDGLQAALDGKEAVGVAAAAVAAHKIEADAHAIGSITGLIEAIEAASGGSSSTAAAGYSMLDIVVSGTGYQGTVSASRLTLENSFGASKTLRDISLSFNGATVGANGLDSGAISSGNWYYIFVIYNQSTSTAATLLSLSNTSPSLPAGYEYKFRVGAARAPAAATNFIAQEQKDNEVTFGVGAQNFITLVSGSTNTTATAVSTLTAAPPTAAAILIAPYASSGAVSVYTDYVNPVPYLTSSSTFVTSGYIPLKVANSITYRMVNPGTGYVRAFGYKERL